MMSRMIVCFLATFVANGLARFGYVVLIPVMILSGALTTDQSYALAIAILIGYIFGDFWLRWLTRYISAERCASLSFLLIGISFIVCMISDLPFVFTFFWRFLAGMASASLMILAAPLCLPLISARHKGKASGIIFSGIGTGAVVSGLVLPWIAHININFAWLSLALVALLATCYSFITMRPGQSVSHVNSNISVNKITEKFTISTPLLLLTLSYILNAIGYLGHTLFWVDYLVRFLHFSPASAGMSWVFFGAGAVFGSLISGSLSDKLGIKQSHIFILSVKTLSAIIAAFSVEYSWLNFSVFLMGFTTTGNVALTNTMALCVAGRSWFTRASGMLTFYFGLFQAIFSFIFSYWMKVSGNYFWLFIVCAFALFLSALVLLPVKLKSDSFSR